MALLPCGRLGRAGKQANGRNGHSIDPTYAAVHISLLRYELHHTQMPMPQGLPAAGLPALRNHQSDAGVSLHDAHWCSAPRTLPRDRQHGVYSPGSCIARATYCIQRSLSALVQLQQTTVLCVQSIVPLTQRQENGTGAIDSSTVGLFRRPAACRAGLSTCISWDHIVAVGHVAVAAAVAALHYIIPAMQRLHSMTSTHGCFTSSLVGWRSAVQQHSYRPSGLC